MAKDSEPKYELYRMVMTEHMCPSGLKAKDFLDRQGIDFEDHHLTSRPEVDAFKEKHGVETTPQLLVDGKAIGGYEATLKYFGKEAPKKNETSYQPVIALFAVGALMAIAVTWLAAGTLVSGMTFPKFIAISMVLLGLQKLKDIESFSSMFLTYDLLAQRQVRYGYVYPFLETGAGLLMLAGALTWLAAPVALVIGGIGAISVFKAVYIDKRELKCACVGGDSNVPLGFVSLTENVMMVGMALWMLTRIF
ncbi:glutaredoxin family protein [Paracoccaceae bacterium GXU_MW_L88]